jgi:Bacterial toxin 47
MEHDPSNPHYKKPDYYSYNSETAEGAQPDSLGIHPSQKKKEAIVPNLLQPESPHKNLPPELKGFNPDPNGPKIPDHLRKPLSFTSAKSGEKDTDPNASKIPDHLRKPMSFTSDKSGEKDTDPNASKIPEHLRKPMSFTSDKSGEKATDPNASKIPEHLRKPMSFSSETRPKDLNPNANETNPDLSPMLIAGAIPMPVQGPLLPELGEAAATAAKVLLTPLTEFGTAGAAAVMGGATAIVGGEGIFHSLNEGEAEYLRKNAALLKSQHQTTPAPHPAQPHVSAPAADPIAAPVSMPRTPAKAQFPAAELDRPSALDLEIQQQRKAQAAQAKQEEAKQKKQSVAWKTLQTEQSKLYDFNAGYSLSGSDLETFSQGLTPQQRQAVQAQATARNAKLTEQAKEAGMPLSKDEIAQQQQQIEQRVLYEQYTPAREIYHFAGQFLNGYTPQKMQTVRGYFDGVFAGTYPKAIPAEKRGAIESSADAKYTAETGQKADRESPLWKTLRNIEASEKYPDLWDGFRNDLSASEQTGVLKTITNPNDPSLGSNALNRPTQGSTLNVPSHTGHPAGTGQQKQQPVGGGFDDTTNPELTRQTEGFPTNQHVDGVAHVFDSGKAELRYRLGPNDVDLRGSDTTFKDALTEAFQRTGVPREQFKVTKWGKDVYGKSVPVEYTGPGAAEISIDYAHYGVDAQGRWSTGPDAPHIGWKIGKGSQRQVGHIIIDDVPAGRPKNKE